MKKCDEDCSKTVLRVSNVGKRYRMLESLKKNAVPWYLKPLANLKDIIGLLNFSENEDRRNEFWALEGVSFEVQAGESVGIIGANGAGKSTLLKLLSRITAPTTGRIEIAGKVSALLEVGTGFNPELTGRENVYMNGTLMGMSRKKIDENLEEIIEFAGVGDHLDMPVKRYSSGMRVRLGFAVASFLEQDILIVDEVLAVGDAKFRERSSARMKKSIYSGGTILFVSHNMGLIESLCDRVILLEKGKVIYDGDTKGGIRRYLAFNDNDTLGDCGLINLDEHPGRKSHFYTLIKITSFTISNELGETTTELSSGANVVFKIAFEKTREFDYIDSEFRVVIKNEAGEILSTLADSVVEGLQPLDFEVGVKTCTIKKLPLASGEYWLNLACFVNGQPSDSVANVVKIMVSDGVYYDSGKLPHHDLKGAFYIDHTWD
jgi:lipopolysaccharide transport system ATP-binding protein